MYVITKTQELKKKLKNPTTSLSQSLWLSGSFNLKFSLRILERFCPYSKVLQLAGPEKTSKIFLMDLTDSKQPVVGKTKSTLNYS